MRALLIGLVLVVAGCTSGQLSSATPFPTRIALPSGRVSLPDHGPCKGPRGGDPCVDVGHSISGLLSSDDDCVWIVMDNGIEVRVIWPLGYSAELRPFVVFDNAGSVVARSGDRIQADGEGPLVGEADNCGRTKYVTLIDPVVPRN